MRKLCLIIVVAILGLPMATLAQQDVVNTVHNLSTSGPGTFRSLTVDEVCVFCHTPHNARPEAPLWNRMGSAQTYTEYGSTTIQAVPGEPSGKSQLCLACHDGTIALGALVNQPSGGSNDLLDTFLTGRANLDSDLSDDHPISFVYDSNLVIANPELAQPSVIDLPLENQELQCTSCHDPHQATPAPFLHKTSLGGELCTTCHERSGNTWDWTTSSHATSTATPTGANPWANRKPQWQGADVAENSCFNCHTPHNAITPQRLIKDLEEATCFLCHNGTVAAGDIEADFLKVSAHPVDITPNADHDNTRVENPLTMSLHAECADCHNPHGAGPDLPMISFNPASPLDGNHTIAPAANARILGVTGVDINGVVKAELDFQYELCFKCHGLPGRSACGSGRCDFATTNSMTRLDGVYNIRDKVDENNPALVSFHPLVTNNPLNDDEVPSLRDDIPLNTSTSLIYCTDCHSSDQGPAAGFTGATGPHGSIDEPILAMRQSLLPQNNNMPADSLLCFKCHDENEIDGTRSFRHRSHVFNRGASCMNCHDPHGSAVYPHLLNFQTSTSLGGATLTITGPNDGSFPVPTWIDDGEHAGTCFLNCHGSNHPGRSYR